MHSMDRTVAPGLGFFKRHKISFKKSCAHRADRPDVRGTSKLKRSKHAESTRLVHR